MKSKESKMQQDTMKKLKRIIINALVLKKFSRKMHSSSKDNLFDHDYILCLLKKELFYLASIINNHQ